MLTKILTVLSVVLHTEIQSGFSALAAHKYECDPSKPFVEILLGHDVGQRTAILSASLDRVRETRSCAFRIFTTDPSHVVYFRPANISMNGPKCEDTNVRLYDVENSRKTSKGSLLEEYCSHKFGPYLRSVSSSSNGLFVELFVRGPYWLAYKAEVIDLPTPCEFFCATEAKCLIPRQRCDRFLDCKDGSDEQGCYFPEPVGQQTQDFGNNQGTDDRSGTYRVAMQPDIETMHSGIVGALDIDPEATADRAGGGEDVLEDDGPVEDHEDIMWAMPYNPIADDEWGQSEDRGSMYMGGIDSGCGNSRVQTGLKGSFSSNNYPCSYGPLRQCTWDINVPPSKSIVLSFNKIFAVGNVTLSVDGKSSSCHGDRINFFARHTPNQEEALIKSVCGSTAPSSFFVGTNKVRVELRSGQSGIGQGFRLHWAAATKRTIDLLKKPAEGVGKAAGVGIRPEHNYKSAACSPSSRGAVMTAPSGAFGSPRTTSSKNYTHGAKCTWIVSGGSDQVVVLFFAKFHLEKSAGCEFDSVEVYDGTKLLGKYCGSAFIKPIVSKSNKLVVKFTSDNYVEHLGFAAFYRIVDASEYTEEHHTRGATGIHHQQPTAGHHLQSQTSHGQGVADRTISGHHQQPQTGHHGTTSKPRHHQDVGGESGHHGTVTGTAQAGHHAKQMGGAGHHQLPQAGHHPQPQAGHHQLPQTGHDQLPQTGHHPQPQAGHHPTVTGQPLTGHHVTGASGHHTAQPGHHGTASGSSHHKGSGNSDIEQLPDDEYMRSGQLKRLPSLRTCGRVEGGGFGATFSTGCHGALIHRRWMLATTNCLVMDNKTHYDYAPIVDWETKKEVGTAEKLTIKTFKFRGEDSLSSPIRFTGLNLIQLAQPLDEDVKTPAILCLPTDTEDDDVPDASCELTATPMSDGKTLYDKHKLSNDQCRNILLATQEMAIPTDRLHIFECFLVQADEPDKQLILDVSQLEIAPKYCEVSQTVRYGAIFNEMPMKFCQNYEGAWSLSSVLVQVLTSNPLFCPNDHPEGLSTDAAKNPQTIAVYVRVSHFFEWIFTMTSNQNSNKFLATHEL